MQNEQIEKSPEDRIKETDKTEKNAASKGSRRGFWAVILIAVVLIPLTIIISWRLGDRKYYIASVLIMIYSMIPFFISFERRKPQPRELMTLAVMCAIAVVSRAIFIAVPHFKPIGAIVMITGMAFGPQAGFMTGALSMLISDIIFGQGPWTPWQMLAFGLIGFIAGLMSKAEILSRKKPAFNALIGFLMIFLLVGPILDTSTVFTMIQIPGVEVLAIYLAGIPINAIHGSAVALGMLLLTRPMLEKLDRIKVKYGMMEL